MVTAIVESEEDDGDYDNFKYMTKMKKGNTKGLLQEIRAYQIRNVKPPLNPLCDKYHVGKFSSKLIEDMRGIEITDEYVRKFNEKRMERFKVYKKKSLEKAEQIAAFPLTTKPTPLQQFVGELRALGITEITLKLTDNEDRDKIQPQR